LYDLLNKRQGERFIDQPTIDAVTEGIPVTVHAIDISDLGAKIITPIGLKIGQLFAIQNRSLPRPYRYAYVVWYNKEKHEAGLRLYL
jgi:hypothetical protein